MDDVRLLLDALTVEDEVEEELDDLLLEMLDDDVAAIVAALEEERLLREHKADWHNAEDKVKNFDEACARLGDSHIEHFTRFTKDEIKTLATEMRIPFRVKVIGYVSPC